MVKIQNSSLGIIIMALKIKRKLRLSYRMSLVLRDAIWFIFVGRADIKEFQISFCGIRKVVEISKIEKYTIAKIKK